MSDDGSLKGLRPGLLNLGSDTRPSDVHLSDQWLYSPASMDIGHKKNEGNETESC